MSKELDSVDAEKKAAVKVTRTKSSVIKNAKWLTTKDGLTFSFMERSIVTRTAKDELAGALKKKNLEVTVLTKNLSIKSTGKKICSYIIAVDSNDFATAFPSIETKATNINFMLAEKENKAAS